MMMQKEGKDTKAVMQKKEGAKEAKEPKRGSEDSKLLNELKPLILSRDLNLTDLFGEFDKFQNNQNNKSQTTNMQSKRLKKTSSKNGYWGFGVLGFQRFRGSTSVHQKGFVSMCLFNIVIE